MQNLRINRRAFGAALASVAMGWVMLTGGPASAGDTAPTVVELFTSQGCSSCPPADRFMGELAQRGDIIALTYHVDYWDYIGWKDTFATTETTNRQRSYGRSLGQRYVYTPQMVVGGRVHKVGSDRMAVDMAVDEDRRHRQIAIDARQTGGDKVTVSIPAGEGSGDVLLMRFDHKHTVDVGRGENAGRELSYYNVVRDFRRVGVWSGDAVQLDLTVAELQDGGRDGCAILLQAPGSGPILGATRINLEAASN